MKNQGWVRRDLLARFPLFSELSRTQLDVLHAGSRLIELAAREPVFHAGETIREAYALVSGTVRRTVRLSDGIEKTIELAQTQQLLAEGEVLRGGRYTSSALAVIPSIVISIKATKLRAMIRHDLDLSWQIIQSLAARQSIAELHGAGHPYGQTSTQRILDYLIQLAGGRPGPTGETTVTLNAYKKIIAGSIGMTPEAFSRGLRQLADSGVIVVEGRTVHIQNAALLEPGVGEESQPVSFRRLPKQAAARACRILPPGTLINLCGRHRVLSQRLAVAWALVAFRIAPERGRVALRKLDAEFARNLVRLDKAELPARIASMLQTTTQAWQRYHAALTEAEPTATHAGRLIALSEETLDAADRLTRLAEEVAGVAGARYVNVAGRNRMLSQQIVKLFVFEKWRPDSEGIPGRLEAVCREFEDNLAELRHQGLQHPAVLAQLDEVARHWAKFRTALTPGPVQGMTGRQTLAVITAGERLLRHVDTAVKLYERLAS
jgi:CRP-like cAMP-binding protein